MVAGRLTGTARRALRAGTRAPRQTLRMFTAPFERLRGFRQPPPELLFVPQDLRTTDASFIDEIRAGHFGLAGHTIEIGAGTPFEALTPGAAFKRRLHGFTWLRHLRAVREEGGDEIARRYVLAWIKRYRAYNGSVFEPPVLARRIVSWLNSASVLLEGADPRTYETVMKSLVAQVRHLAGTVHQAPPGLPRLGALTALMLASICIAGEEHLIGRLEAELAAELETQVLPFGGLKSRNPGSAIELLLDLLPLRQCISMRDREPNEAIESAIARMVPWLRYMRLGDGRLARFNGMSGTPLDELATVLVYDDSLAMPPATPAAGYLRMNRGASILIMDVGVPPPLELSGAAHAGCLSFEMSSGHHVLIVNSGAAGFSQPEWHTICRSTAAHSTLTVNSASSSRLVSVRAKGARGGLVALAGPEKVAVDIAESGGSVRILATHDGYLERYGVVHRRILALADDGTSLEGRDYLGPRHKGERLARDLAYDLHFHIHPHVGARMGAEMDTVDLKLANGELWRFRASGARLALEESTYLAEFAGPRQSVQIVLRGDCLDNIEIPWRLERVGPTG